MRKAILLLFLLLLLLPGCRRDSPQLSSLKIVIDSDGLYAVTLRELQRTGLILDELTTEDVELSEGGVSVPYLIDADTLYFYGRASTSRYTAKRPYVLRTGVAGRAMKQTDAPPTGVEQPAVVSTLKLEENFEYISDARLGANLEPWFWHTIPLQGEVSLEFSLPAVTDGAGELTLSAYGSTHNPDADPDHSVSLYVNERKIADIMWEGQSVYSRTVTLPPGTLQTGANSVLLENTPEPFVDIMKLDWLSVRYQAEPVATDGRIRFAAADGALSIHNFDERPILVDVADPAEPALLTGWNYEAGSVRIGTSNDMVVLAVAPASARRPRALVPMRHSEWASNERQADLIILTTDALAPSLEPLVAAREAQGLSVVVVPVAEVYDEFGYGMETPDSINAFLRHAKGNWASPQPRYLLIVGDATSDFKGYLAKRPENPVHPPENVIPPYLVAVNYSGETVSDARLADIDGDFKPDFAVGRWPVDSPELVSNLVARTLAYEESKAPVRAVFAADASSNEFMGVTRRVLGASDFPESQSTVLRGPQAGRVAELWNEGAWLMTYTGHGSLQLWGKDNIFSSDSVSLIESDGFAPIVLQLTCLSGLFAHPETTSLSELLLRHENGPVLLIGATSLTLSSHQEPFAVQLLRALQDPSVTRMGDAVLIAKNELNLDVNRNLREIVDTFGLIGDPSALIVRP